MTKGVVLTVRGYLSIEILMASRHSISPRVTFVLGAPAIGNRLTSEGTHDVAICCTNPKGYQLIIVTYDLVRLFARMPSWILDRTSPPNKDVRKCKFEKDSTKRCS